MGRSILGAVVGLVVGILLTFSGIVVFFFRDVLGAPRTELGVCMVVTVASLSIIGAVAGGTGAVLTRIEDLGHFARRRFNAIEGSKPSGKPENEADDGSG